MQALNEFRSFWIRPFKSLLYNAEDKVADIVVQDIVKLVTKDLKGIPTYPVGCVYIWPTGLLSHHASVPSFLSIDYFYHSFL